MINARKAVFAALLIIALMGAAIPVSASDARRFSDWNPSAWYAPAMEWCVQRGYFKGTDRNTIEAERPITRAEFLAVMVRYAHCAGAADVSFFRDISPKDWFYPAVSIGYAAGITNGMDPALFVPNMNISREQAFTMYVRAVHPAGGTVADLNSYRDADAISGWARDAVSKIIALGVVEGYEDRTLRPKREISRAEVAQMLYRSDIGTFASQEEREAQYSLNDVGSISISLNTELWVSLQATEAACAISYGRDNSSTAEITLTLTGTSAAELFRAKLYPGDSLGLIRLKHLPGAGTYPAQFTVAQDSGATVRFEALLHISDP